MKAPIVTDELLTRINWLHRRLFRPQAGVRSISHVPIGLPCKRKVAGGSNATTIRLGNLWHFHVYAGTHWKSRPIVLAAVLSSAEQSL
jgi:hypothetical protein